MTDPTVALVAVLAFLKPDLDRSMFQTAISCAKLLPDDLKDVLDYVRRHPAAVRTRPATAPPGLHALLTELDAVPLVPSAPAHCAGCGKQRRLPYRAPGGRRWCPSCYNDSRRTPCRRCGTLAVPMAREEDGVVCARCRNADPDRQHPCSRCHRPRPVTYRIDGQPVCKSCGPKRLHTCSACGRPDQPASAITGTGPICPRCYHRSRPHTCHQCRRSTPQARRDAARPELWICYRCFIPPTAECIDCGRTRPCAGGVASGKPICSSCQSRRRPRLPAAPAQKKPCTQCGLTRPVRITLPLGPVCHTCCHQLRENPITCASCGHKHPWADLDARDRPICGPCSGDRRNWHCRTCGTVDLLVTTADCVRCQNTARINEALHCSHPKLHAQMDSVRDLLLQTYPPQRTEILLATPESWLTLLTAPIRDDEPLSHSILDREPQGMRIRYLRRLLTALEILPPRNDTVDGLELWLDALLADQPPHITAVLLPYAHWHVAHRLRRTPGNSPSAAKYARTRIRCAADFLLWLQSRGTNLAQATQHDVDYWLDHGATTRRRLRGFLTWSNKRGLTTDLEVPWLGTDSLPGHVLDEDTRWRLLRRCLTEPALDLRVRVAGALVLLFGQNLIRIAALRTEDITADGCDTYLTLRDHPVLLPPALATLVRDLAGQPPPADDPCPPGTPSWLFPGRNAAHLYPGRLARLLNRDLGLDARAGRGGALLALAADLPASVLADLLGFSVDTALRWTALAARDHGIYLAARLDEGDTNVGVGTYPRPTR